MDVGLNSPGSAGGSGEFTFPSFSRAPEDRNSGRSIPGIVYNPLIHKTTDRVVIFRLSTATPATPLLIPITNVSRAISVPKIRPKKVYGIVITER